MRQSLDDIPWLESLFGFPRDNRASTAENNWISFKKNRFRYERNPNPMLHLLDK